MVITDLLARPRSTGEALLAAFRTLERLQRRDPSTSGRLRLRLSGARRDWQAGRLSDHEFGVVLAGIVAASGSPTG